MIGLIGVFIVMVVLTATAAVIPVAYGFVFLHVYNWFSPWGPLELSVVQVAGLSLAFGLFLPTHVTGSEDAEPSKTLGQLVMRPLFVLAMAVILRMFL